MYKKLLLTLSVAVLLGLSLADVEARDPPRLSSTDGTAGGTTTSVMVSDFFNCPPTFGGAPTPVFDCLPVVNIVCREGAGATCAAGGLPGTKYFGPTQFTKTPGKDTPDKIAALDCTNLAAIFPTPPYGIQIVGTNSNNGRKTVTGYENGADQNGDPCPGANSVLLLLGTESVRNETTVQSALAPTEVTLSLEGTVPGVPASVYSILFLDDRTTPEPHPVTEARQEGNGAPVGGYGGFTLTLPKVFRECSEGLDGDFALDCRFIHLVDNGQENGAVRWAATQHNFANCSDGAANCVMHFGVPSPCNTGCKKKYFKAVTTSDGEAVGLGVDFQVAVRKGSGLGPVFHRACNLPHQIDDGSVPTNFDCSLRWDTAGESYASEPVDLRPNPLNGSGGGAWLTADLTSTPQVDVANLDGPTGRLEIRGTSGLSETVFSVERNSLPGGFNWKFDRQAVLCAVQRVNRIVGSIPDGYKLEAPGFLFRVNFAQNTNNEANGVEGESAPMVLNGAFDTSGC